MNKSEGKPVSPFLVTVLAAIATAAISTTAFAQGRGLIIPSDVDDRLEVQIEASTTIEFFAQGVGAPPRSSTACQPTFAKFDLRAFGFVTPPKNQGNCGSCWAFATTSAIETSYLYLSGAIGAGPNLSEQEVLDCSGSVPLSLFPNAGKIGHDCMGGWFEAPFKYGNSNGILPDAAYRSADGQTGYREVKGACVFPQVGQRQTAFNWGYAAGINRGSWIASTHAIKEAICRYGGVVTALDTSKWPPFSEFKGQVIVGDPTPNSSTPRLPEKLGHAVQIIGWDNDFAWTGDGGAAHRGAWIIKNSWGDQWGDRGFVYIPYGHQMIGMLAAWVRSDFQRAVGSIPPSRATQLLNFRQNILSIGQRNTPISDRIKSFKEVPVR